VFGNGVVSETAVVGERERSRDQGMRDTLIGDHEGSLPKACHTGTGTDDYDAVTTMTGGLMIE